MKAQILLSGQTSICIVEIFFVILAHLCILLGVFEESVLSTTSWVVFKAFIKHFLTHFKFLFKASYKYDYLWLW